MRLRMMSFIATILVVSVLNLACSSPNNNSSSSTQSTSTPSSNASSVPASTAHPPSPPPQHELSVEEKVLQEAHEQVNAVLKAFFIKCGDSYYWDEVTRGIPGERFMEGKGEANTVFNGYYLAPKALTEAERLNGVDPQPMEWKGDVTISYRIARTLECPTCPKGVSYGWQDNPGLVFHLWKTKGKWQFLGLDPRVWFKKLKCSDVPKQQAQL